MATIISSICWLATIGGVCVGCVILAGGMATAKSAPQEAVVVTLACASAILPYCLARAVTEIVSNFFSLVDAASKTAKAKPEYNYKKI
ncbi:MAG: hypothetical protein WAU71_04050 [Pyrinomonadaceae bacterium]